MSVFAALPQPLATDRQLFYLHQLVMTRADIPLGEPDRLPAEVRKFVPHAGMTIDEASAAIDFWKKLPTIRSRARAALLSRQDEHLQRVREWLTVGVESEIASRWDAILAVHFEIDREVPGTHWTGKKLRIDRILRPLGWTWSCGHSHEVGFEIKTDRAKWPDVVGQAADYGNSTWATVAGAGHVLVGIYIRDIDETRQLAPLGCFGFSLHRAWLRDWDTDPDLHIHWNGTRMWTGTTNPNKPVDRRIAQTKWCPTRKFGSR